MSEWPNVLNESHHQLAGKKMRLVVDSPEQAVQIIRERLGPKGQVLSVKQIKGEGLMRFLKAPKLEVIAIIPDELSFSVKEPIVVSQKTLQSVYANGTHPPVVPDEPSQSLNKFLQRCGFDEALLCDLFSSNDWRAWEFLPLNEAILKVVARFRESYLAQFKKKLTPRMAFIGPPGAGTTTVLCKLLSQAVFLKGEKPQVLKWDSDGPNANEALEVFCEVLGVKWYRDPVDRPHLVLDQPLYMDVPGLPLDHPDWPILMKTLDDLAIDTRIFIMNGLYEKDYLQKAYVLAEQLKTTHLVFTHLDEVLLATKLWRFLFRKNITVLGFSHGQSLTGTFSDDPLEWLLSATF